MDSPAALAQQVETFMELGDLNSADRALARALAQHSDHPDILRTSGILRLQQGRLAEAVQSFTAALAQDPNDALTHNYLGEAHSLAGDQKTALSSFQMAIHSNPRLAVAHANMGNVALQQGEMATAEAAFTEALALDENSAAALLGLGNLADGRGNLETALEYYLRAQEAAPMFVPTIQNLAVLQFRLGDIQTALDTLDDGLSMFPNDPKLRANRGMIRLMTGDWSAGWPDYLSRLDFPPVSKNTWSSWLTLWEGQDLGADGMVVWMEQGVGDFIVCLHALPYLKERVKNIVIACDLRLSPVLQKRFPDIPVIAEFDIGHKALKDQNVKYHAPAFEMIRYAYTSPDDIPAREPWFVADPDRKADLRKRYEARAGGRPIVGLSWQSRKSIHHNDSSVSLSDLATVLKTGNAFYVSLQYGDTEEEIADFAQTSGIEVLQDPDINQLKDMASFVDQVAVLDCALVTGATVAHVAGALHIPATVLSHDRGDGVIWHRFTERTDSPWYPRETILRWKDKSDLETQLLKLDWLRGRA